MENEKREFYEIPQIKNGGFTASYVGEKTARLDGISIWRSDINNDGQIAIKINGKVSSVNNDPTSKRGNPNLYALLDSVLDELGIHNNGTDGDSE